MEHPVQFNSQPLADAEWLRQCQVKLLYEQAPIAIFNGLGVGLVVIAVLWNKAPNPLLLAWGFGLLCTSGLRILLTQAFSRQTQPGQRYWEYLYTITGGLAGAVWGSLGLFLDANWPTPYQIVIYIVLLGIPSGALASNGVYVRVYMVFVIPVVTPIIITLARSEDPLYLALGLLVMLYLLMLLSAARGYQRNVLHTLRLHRQNTALLASVTQANADLRQEMTGRERIDENLRQEQEKLQITLHSIGDAVITSDVTGHIEYLNPIAERLTGWALHEARHQPLTQVLKVLEETQGYYDPVQACLECGNMLNFSGSNVLVNRNDQRHAITLTAAPLRRPNGNLLGVVLAFHDISDVRNLTTALAYQATHDPLTGLINRREFESRLYHALESARTEQRSHLLLYMDLDQFKVVNDTCGHTAGDELLRQLAAILPQRLRITDTLGRLGGDEFGVLLAACPLQKGLIIADELRKTVSEFRFTWEDKMFQVGVSIGLVTVTAENADVAELLSAADVACYAAKDLGRNRVHVYQASDADLARRQGEMHWIARINQALQDKQLELHFQEIVAITAVPQLARHVEVLIRMRDTHGALIPPNAFIPAAERYNLMPTLDRWVVENLFAWYAEKPRSDLICAINLSGTSLSDPGFLPFIKARFEHWGLPAEAFCFEITETAAVADLANASHFIREMRALGCQFSLDDFGSGLSSFGYLKNLPVDYLKIDGSFIRDLTEDPVDYAMVEAIHALGRVMGKQTIAEFVETAATYHALAAIGVDFAQGYLFGRPRPMREWDDGIPVVIKPLLAVPNKTPLTSNLPGA